MGLEAIQSAIGSMKDFSVEVINTVTPISRCCTTQKECILEFFIKTKNLSPSKNGR